MNFLNEMYLKIPAVSVNESFARGTVAAFCVSANPTLEEINDIKTAVSEAVTNCVVHGYRNKNGDIEIRAVLYNAALEIEIKDKGVGIENTQEAMQPFFTTKPEEERSGMGFTVMQAFMDEVDIVSSPGKGTAVRMKKYFSAAGEGAESDA